MPAAYKIRPKSKTSAKKVAQAHAPSSGSFELKEPSTSYFVRNIEVPEFFGQQLTKGERLPVDQSAANSSPRLFYSHPHGEIWLGDSIEWLRRVWESLINPVSRN